MIDAELEARIEHFRAEEKLLEDFHDSSLVRHLAYLFVQAGKSAEDMREITVKFKDGSVKYITYDPDVSP